MTLKKKKDLGNFGEQVAVAFLKENGYKILYRNFYCKQGEIDIIAKDENKNDSEIVFVEVKTRTNNMFGKPADAVNGVKINHICKSAKYFLFKFHLTDAFVRFDVIEVFLENGKFNINHIKQII